MSFEDQVRQAKSPREAILILAREIDALHDQLATLSEWDSWGDDDGFPIEAVSAAVAGSEVRVGVGPDGLTDHEREQHRLAMLAMANTEARDFEIPAPSEEKMEYRRMMERQQLKLALALGEEAGEEDWTEAYAKGGPWWLWQERRDIVMGLPFDTRQRMVADVEEDSPKLAYEMGLDVLKRETGEPDFENGSGALAIANVTSKSARR